jgi:hypothetical protein
MKKHRTLVVIIFIYVLSVAVIFAFSLFLNNGDFVYALDDPYIHMTMANNLVNNGNWAVNQMDYASASSSPMWVLLISAVYFLFGVNVGSPFILNLLFQILSIIIIYLKLKEYGNSGFLAPMLLLIIFATPFPAILFTGMEHSAQIAFALLFVFFGIKLINDNGTSRYAMYLIFITPILTALRYENIILVFLISVLLFSKRKPFYGALILILGLIPFLIYGFISMSHGWFFFPNTLLLKSTPPGFSIVDFIRFGFKAFTNITEPHLFLVLISCLFLYTLNFKKQKSFWDEKQLFLMIASVTIIVNMSVIEYHQNGAFYRYEAYLMALGLFAIAISIHDFLPDFNNILWKKSNLPGKYIIFILLLFTISPLILRFFTAFGIPHATKEYHDQQYQMAQFVKQHAKGMNVALNDIGMVGFYSDNKIVDLWGVANIDVAKQKLNKTYSTNSIIELTKNENIRLAILYENWFDEYGGLPSSWVKLAEWTMTDYNFFLGMETVSFYSIAPEDVRFLKAKLKEFSLKLPNSVICKIY